MSETRVYNDILDFNPNIPNYNFEFVRTPLSAGGVGMYIDETMYYTVIERTSKKMRHFRLCGLNCNFGSKVILSVASLIFIGNIIPWIVS